MIAGLPHLVIRTGGSSLQGRVCERCCDAYATLARQCPPARRDSSNLGHDRDGERQSPRRRVARLDDEKDGEQHRKEWPISVEAEKPENAVPRPRGGEPATEGAEQHGELFGPAKWQCRDRKEDRESGERGEDGAREPGRVPDDHFQHAREPGGITWQPCRAGSCRNP